MNLKKAIEIKKHYQYVLPKESYPELIVADNISIEAMRNLLRARRDSKWPSYQLLPGETKD